MEHRDKTGGVIIQAMPLPSTINLAYSGKTRWLVPRDSDPNPSIQKFSSILIPWSITGLAALPLIPYRRSIDTKHSGYNFPTWTSESTVAMTTVCHNHCMHLIAVNQLVYTRAPEMYVSNIPCMLI